MKRPRKTFLRFAPPSLDDAEITAVVDALQSGWITTGPRVAAFESSFSNFVNGGSTLAVNSGTAALHLALLALGVGPGHCVVTTPLTFCSTIHVIEHVGATPVLVDVEPDTLNIDPAQVAVAIDRLTRTSGPTPKAILPVHFGGQPCDMTPIIELASRYDLAIIEDAAHALPAHYKGRLVGDIIGSAIPRAVCFSFYATKNMTTGEGGMLIADSDAIATARTWSLHGMTRDAWARYEKGGSWQYDVVAPGFKYNMTDIQAALGLVQLSKLCSFHEHRIAIANRYTAAFTNLPSIEVPAVRSGTTSAWHLYPIRLRLDRLSIDRSRFIDELTVRNIGSSVHFIPVHTHSFYADRYGWNPEDFPVTHAVQARLISLPIHPGMTDSDADDVVKAVIDITEQYRA